MNRAIAFGVDRPVVGIVRAGQREVDVADRGAALGHAVLHDQLVHLHVMRLGDVDDAELAAEQAGDVHLRVSGGRDGNAVLMADLARLHVAGIAAAQEHDGVVLAAGAGLPHQRQPVITDRHERFLGRHRPVAMGGARAWMQVPVDIGQEGLQVLVVIDLGFLRAREGPHLEIAARCQAEGIDQQEAISAHAGMW